jgi:hypothetical protein
MATFTRAHFELIAWIIKSSRALIHPKDTLFLESFDHTFVPMVCAELRRLNPRFDAQVFKRAAGIPE